jgi:hypothetical protein
MHDRYGPVLVQTLDDNLTIRSVTEKKSHFDVTVKDFSVPCRLHVDVIEPPRPRRRAGRFAGVAGGESSDSKHSQKMSPKPLNCSREPDRSPKKQGIRGDHQQSECKDVHHDRNSCVR